MKSQGGGEEEEEAEKKKKQKKTTFVSNKYLYTTFIKHYCNLSIPHLLMYYSFKILKLGFN